MRLVVLSVSGLAGLVTILASPIAATLPGTFVAADQLSRCPALTPRTDYPSSASDVRPDDIKVIMAIGDSITAGFLAQPSDSESELSPVDRSGPIAKDTTSSGSPGGDAQIVMSAIPSVKEYRGLSYPIGGDPGAITIPNILSHYTPYITGMSRGHHPLLACVGGWCVWRYDDGLNGAVSGSTSGNLLSQVRDYVVPTFEKMDVLESDWKYINVGIGANDICAFCLSPNTSIPGIGAPEIFARGIKDAVDLLREHVPNLIVNIVGLFRVSAIYQLTLKDPYCRGPHLPIIPHLPLECSCALLPGPAGDYTRAKMDALSEEYDTAVHAIIKQWNEEGDPGFGARWQPGAAIDLAHWPIEALSPVDCFHPSEKAHQRVAAGFWNRLTLSTKGRAEPIVWEKEVRVRCLESDDRISLGV